MKSSLRQSKIQPVEIIKLRAHQFIALEETFRIGIDEHIRRNKIDETDGINVANALRLIYQRIINNPDTEIELVQTGGDICGTNNENCTVLKRLGKNCNEPRYLESDQAIAHKFSILPNVRYPANKIFCIPSDSKPSQ